MNDRLTNHVIDATAEEAERLRRLEDYRMSYTPAEASFDEIARLAAVILKAPIALVCTAEATCHWFKARVGMDLTSVPRSISFCDFTMKGDGAFVVLDASVDPDFADNPLITGEPHLRFYVGVPLCDSDGYKLGTLCVLDTEPRDAVGRDQLEALESLARITLDRMELRRYSANLAEARAKAEIAEQEAHAAHARLHDAIDILPEAIVFMDADDRYVLWNRRYAELFPELATILKPGLHYEDALRFSLASGAYPEDVQPHETEAWLTRRLAEHRKNGIKAEQRFRDGRWVRYDERRTSDGGSIGIRVDISDLKQREESVRLLFERNPVPMLLADTRTLALLAVNQATLDHFGFDRGRALGIRLPDIWLEDEDAIRGEVLRQSIEGSEQPRPRRYRRADGSGLDVLPFVHTIEYDGRPMLLIAAVDVTQRLQAEARIKHLAHHDPLTQLPNRALFHERLSEALLRAEAEGTAAALCLIDLDRFKAINDSLGHVTGDAVLQMTAERLSRAVGPGDTVARLGGDEFAALLTNLAPGADVASRLARLAACFEAPITFDGDSVAIAGSIGAAVGPADGADPADLMRNADIALYRAKASSEATPTLFDRAMRESHDRLARLVARFRLALRQGELAAYYQPIVSLSTFRLRGFEALLRWYHPEKGLLPASAFVEVFDDPELAVEIGRFMLETTAADMRDWHGRGVAFGSVGINVTAADLKSDGFADRVIAVLDQSRLPRSALVIEVTENSLVERDNGCVTRVLNRLDEQGIVIALDDFGTGHASLVHLRELNVASLKIDQSFVRNMVDDHDDAAIVRAVTTLAHNLDIRTVAEGVETLEQVRDLIDLGCTFGQGFLFGRPMPASQVPYFAADHGEAAPVRQESSRVA